MLTQQQTVLQSRSPVLGARRAGGPRLCTFGTFGLEGRGPRHHLLFLGGTGLGWGEDLPLSSFLKADPTLLLVSTWPLLGFLPPTLGALAQKAEAGGKEQDLFS